MPEQGWVATQFERWRPHLASVAYSMLGSVSEAEDAVQLAWLRLGRSDAAAIEDMRAWLTTVVGRICLDILRSRKAHPQQYAGAWLPEPLVVEPAEEGPEHQAEIADSVGLAMLVVLENLSPAERLAFVLHDVFGLSYSEVGQVVGRTDVAARQLASRARRRVRAAPEPDRDTATARRAVDAFLAAARNGDFEALLRVLAPDVVFRFDLGPGREPQPTLTGAEEVAGHVVRTAKRYVTLGRTAIVNGAPGLVFGRRDSPLSVVGFTVTGGLIAELNLVADPAKLRHLTTRARSGGGSTGGEDRLPGES